MSVLACDRNSCKNIMCGRLSDEYGYICGECFQELVESNPSNPSDIQKFMNSQKKKISQKEFNKVYDELDNEFPMT